MFFSCRAGDAGGPDERDREKERERERERGVRDKRRKTKKEEDEEKRGLAGKSPHTFIDRSAFFSSFYEASLSLSISLSANFAY